MKTIRNALLVACLLASGCAGAEEPAPAVDAPAVVTEAPPAATEAPPVAAEAPAPAAEAAAPGADEPILVESGRASFLRHCSACHGLEARGNGILKPVLLVPPADLTRIAERRGGVFPDAEIARYIDGREDVLAHGSREMPVWGRVFAAPVVDGATGEEVVRGQLWVLVAYLRSIQVGPVAPSE